MTKLNDFIWGKDITRSHVIFSANKDELEVLKKYVSDQKNKGISDDKILRELFSLGWTRDEVGTIAPNELKKYNKRKWRTVAISVLVIFSALTLMVIVQLFGAKYNSEMFEVLSFIPLFISILYLFTFIRFQNTKVSTIDRRVLLLFNRLEKIFGLKEFTNHDESFANIKRRNENKIFLPVKESYPFKVFGGHGQYKGKRFNIFVAKKYAHSKQELDPGIFHYYIFYEFFIRPVPFYYSIVKEEYFEAQSKRIQKSKLKKGDFTDMDFAANEFNVNWRLRGSDKKMAYQVFGPHMKTLIIKINKKDFVGLEISDQSLILSNRLTYHAVSRCPYDFDLLYEISRQVERNYRG